MAIYFPSYAVKGYEMKREHQNSSQGKRALSKEGGNVAALLVAA